ncbi:transposase, partial [Turicibacter sp. 1E2]
MTLIKEVFPKAKIVLDKFHIVQLVSRALNKTRIRFMNQNKEFYNKFKHYWRLLLKAQEDLNATHYFYSNCFKKMISQQEIIDFLLALDPELKETYDFYQTVQQAIKLRNLEIFHHAIQHPSDLLSHEMKTALKTLTHYQDYVKNTIETPYTNGVLEGI